MSRQMAERKATVISIVPFPITEMKPGIYPGNFDIPASKDNIPEALIVGDSIYYVEVDENRSLQIKCPCDDIARSIVDDYLTSNLEYNFQEDAMPGIFWKIGAFTKTEVAIAFATDIKEAVNRQNRWFKKLVERADDDWEKTRQHKCIADMQRFAARALNLERPWIIVPRVEGEGFIKCIACKSLVPSDAVICSICKCILNKTAWDELNLVQSS